MKRSSFMLLTMAALLIGLTSVAHADLRPLANIDLFPGINLELFVEVQHQVFAPGEFTDAGNTWSNSFPMYSTPDLASNYVYAYRLINQPNSTTHLAVFNLGLAGGPDTPITSLGYDLGQNEIAPLFAFDAVGSAFFDFGFETPMPGDSSAVLLVASPWAPGTATINLEDTTDAATGRLPSPAFEPVPAPGAALLGMVGLSLIASIRRRFA